MRLGLGRVGRIYNSLDVSDVQMQSQVVPDACFWYYKSATAQQDHGVATYFQCGFQGHRITVFVIYPCSRIFYKNVNNIVSTWFSATLYHCM